MDNLTTLPMGWKPLMEAADANAREVHAAWADAVRKMGGGSFLIEETLATRAMLGVEAETRAHAALLADLRRPASRDFWARWLAEKVGLTVGATAPRWSRYVATDGSAHWILEGDGFKWHKFDDPAIAKIVDPAAALRAALLAVEPA